jgi:hypothetical protein
VTIATFELELVQVADCAALGAVLEPGNGGTIALSCSD